MKTYYLVISLIIALVISCSTADKQGVAAGKRKRHDTIADSLKVRVLYEYFSNGKVKTETSARGNLRHGLTKNYDREGHLLSEVNYENNVRQGMATNYYAETGKVNSTLIYKDGIKEGDEIWYYESGQEFRVTPYVQGKIDGIQKFYFEDGKLMAEVPYKDGYPGVGLKEYKKDGSLITSYPKLIIKLKDYLTEANKVILDISLSDPYAKVTYYKGALKEGKYLHKGLLELATQHGTTQIDFNVAPGSGINQRVVITAKYKTPLGNSLLLTRTYTVNAINNN